MKYTTLGRTGAKVSKVCLGTMNFGAATDEKECFRIMNRAVELGIQFFDTADFYGDPAGRGITETIIGKWFEGEKKRDEVFLATKCYASTGKMGPNDHGLSACHIRKACDESLQRLKTDHIDLYFMHHYDRGYRSVTELHNIGAEKEADFECNIYGSLAPSFEETLEAMDRLKMQDKITYIGSANFPAWAIAHFNGLSRLNHMSGTVVDQEIYNLSNRALEAEVIPACRELGVGLMTYSPLAGGILAGYNKIKERKRFAENDVLHLRDKLQAYDQLCAELGENPSDVAVAWILNNKIVTSVILGPRTVEQLEDCVKALEIKLPEDFLKKLDEIWSGPAGEAPECYAW